MLTKTLSTGAAPSPFELFLSLSNQQHPFILDSANNSTRLGRYSFVGCNPFLVFSSKGHTCRTTTTGAQAEAQVGDPFEVLRTLLNKYAVPSHEHLPFIGGAVGYFGYDLCHFIEKIPQKALDDINIADCFFAFYDGVYVYDHQENTIDLVALGFQQPPAEALLSLEQHLAAAVEKPLSLTPYHNLAPADFQTNMTKAAYLKAVVRIKEYIRTGDIYQANFTQRFACPFTGNPVSFYNTLRTVNPAPFSAYIDTGDCQIISSSPERFIRVHRGQVEIRPIKGTISRGKTAAEDNLNRAKLLSSEKDRAELLMIVDLERNDLSRIAQTGTVRVPELFAVESYTTVHHLVASVTADLRPECDLIDCIKATFPGGSITGAPKIRAMEIIDELEPTQRNIYTGSIGYLGFDGSMDLNIVIRTVLIKDNIAYLQAGGGIVWDSDPEQEYQESLLKARALMNALQS